MLKDQEILELEDILLSQVPVFMKYLLQKVEPEKAKELTEKVIAAVGNIDPKGAPVTEKELLDAAKAVINGTVTLLPEGEAKKIATTVNAYVGELIDHLDGAHKELIITLIVHFIQTVKSVTGIIKEHKAAQ